VTPEREQELLRAKGFRVIVPRGSKDVMCWLYLNEKGEPVSSTDITHAETLEIAPALSAENAVIAGGRYSHLRWCAWANKPGRNETTIQSRHFSNPIAAATWLLAKVAER
jgi:hypothetical protein